MAQGWTPETPAAPQATGWTPEPSSAPAEESSVNPWMLGLGAAALGAGALAFHKPDLLKKAGSLAMDARRASMLSGLALPKSIMGAVGGAAGASIERGSLAPLKEMLSMETLRDAGKIWKAGPSYEMAGPANLETGLSTVPGLKWLHPGRAMGAFDTAAQNAFVRAGFTPEEAATEMLQAPLGKNPLMDSLKHNPVADFLIPFRRTPMNQFSEGFRSVQPSNLGTWGQRARLGTTIGAGALMGAEAEDPKSIALGTALAGRQGLPFAAAAGITRALTSGSKTKGAEAMQGLSPVSDYSLSQGVLGPVMDPTKTVIPAPAAIGAFDYIRKLLGMN